MIQAKDFAERRVGVGVGAAGDGNHRGQFGVAQSGETASDRDQKKRNRNRWPGGRASVHERSRRAAGAHEVHDYVEGLRMQQGWDLEIFARGGGAGKDENSRTDDRSDAQRGQRPGAESFLQPLAWGLGFGDQLVDRLAAEELVVGGANRGGGFRGWL